MYPTGAAGAPLSRVEDQKFTGAIWPCSHLGGRGANGAREGVRDRGARARARLNGGGEGVRDGVCVLARREGRGEACSIAKPIHENGSPSSSPSSWSSGCGSTE